MAHGELSEYSVSYLWMQFTMPCQLCLELELENVYLTKYMKQCKKHTII